MSYSRKGKIKNNGRQRVEKETAIIICEGVTDKAFLRHMRGLYARNSSRSVTIKTASTGTKVIGDAIKFRESSPEYGLVFALIDEDQSRCHSFEACRVEADKSNVLILWSEPVCLEGMLLGVLDESIPKTNQDCKKTLHPMLARRKPAERRAYEILFTKEVLDKTDKDSIAALRSVFSG